MKLELLAEWLECEGLGKRGKDIFVHHMPDDRIGVLLTVPLVGQRMYPDIPEMRRSRFQVIVRGYDYEAGLEKAEALQAALTWNDKSEVLGDEIELTYMYPRHDPIPFPYSKGDNLEIAVTFDATYFVCG